MGGDKNVVVHSRLTVVPAKPTTPGKVHPLSLLDHMMQLHFVRTVYYFNTSSVKNRSKLLSNLKDSLCKTLSVYPVLAGRLRKRDDGQWEVKCNDAGVRVYEANSNSSLEDCLKSSEGSVESELSRTEVIPDHTISPVAVVQFTDLSCGGLAIGFTWLHLLGDPSFGTLFMKAWGETHRAAQVLHPPFFHPPSLKARPKLSTEVKAVEYYASTFLDRSTENGTESPHGDYRTVTLSFSHDMVEQCISEVQAGSCQYGPSSPSEVLSALLWVSIVKAQSRSSSEHAKLSICLEFRKIHIPPLPHGYVGNALHFLGISSEVGDLISKDLSYAASLINENVAMADTEDIRSVVDWLQAQEIGGGGLCSKPRLLYGPDLTLGIWDQFFSYDAVFDFGKPLRVAYYLEPYQGEGLILVLPSPEGNSSRNVMVTLPKELMSLLCEDAELVRFLPDIRKQCEC